MTEVEMLRAKAHLLVSELVTGADAAKGAAAYIIAPSLDLEYSVAAGVTQKAGCELLTVAHPVRISSATKIFLAAAILRLQEMGKIDLDHAIPSYLIPAHVKILVDGGYDAGAITIRHLLTHTAGLVDVFYTKSFIKMFPELMSGARKHLFTLDEQLQMAMEGGPCFAPGARHAYSDTGYILLGAILEKVAGKSMAAATRELLGFDRLGLDSTWWEVLEPKPDGVPARPHQYVETYDSYTYAEIYDSYNNDPPFDLYGGGGMVSTPKDLAKFFHALFNGQVFKKPETLNIMRSSATEQATDRYGDPYHYGLGVQIRQLDGLTTYAHGGWWGVYTAYAPALNMSVSVIGLKKEYYTKYRAAADVLIVEAARLQKSRFRVSQHASP